MLRDEQLLSLEFDLETVEVPQFLCLSQALPLAQLATALLNYDVRHLGDDVHSLFSPEERKAVMVMIEQIMPELLTTLLKMDDDKLRDKQQREREEIMRWLEESC